MSTIVSIKQYHIALAVFAFALIAFSPLGASLASAQGPQGYGGNRVEVCRATGSKWKPYTAVTVPAFVAQRWVNDGKAVYPTNGACPQPEVTLREYVQDRIKGIFSGFPFFR